MDTKNNIEGGFNLVLSQIERVASKGRGISGSCDILRLFGDVLSFYPKYWGQSMDWAYRDLLRLLAEPEDLLMASAMDADGRGLGEAAARFADAAAALGRPPHYRIAAASFTRKNGNLERSREICREVWGEHPGFQAALSELFECDVTERFWPQDYYDLFADLHRLRQPRVYLEIGVATGKSLALARAGTRALGIDPASAELNGLVYHSPENMPQLYKMTSDDFFAQKDVVKEMGTPHFDVAFIDGLHHFDQVLRDFINLERFAGKESVIMIHDCLPINGQVATRERTTAFWTGDVWKIIPCLQAVRPDLDIVTLPLPPSGVALVRRLDSSSMILERQYASLIQHFDPFELPANWNECCRMLNVLMDESAFDLAGYLQKQGCS